MIKEVDVNEIRIIQNLASEVWPKTYSHILTEHQLEYMFEMMYSTDALENQMKVKGHKFFIFYDDANADPLGFMSMEVLGKEHKVKIHKLYVLTHIQGKGVGKHLVNKAKEMALKKGCTKVFLNVNRHNKAVEFYKHLGMTVVKSEDIDIGNGYLMEDFVMEIDV